jgi:hypothetical protein
MNLYIDKLFRNWSKIGYFITVGIIAWKDDEYETTVKENDGTWWSSDDVVLWLEIRQNRDAIEWCEESN